jgi:hypothetical protein
VYYIHDNGGRPFKVVVRDDAVNVFRQVEDGKRFEYESQACLTISSPIRVLVGKSEENEMTRFSGGFGPDFDGNTVLVETDKCAYTWIGNRGIWSFVTDNSIVSFHSPVGNSDVPYPYAVDEKKNAYLLLDDVVMANGASKDDPYRAYYKSPPPEGVSGLRIKGEPYNWSVVPMNPKATYERYSRFDGDGATLAFEYKDGTLVEMNEEAYCNFCSEHATKLGLRPLAMKQLYKRLW